MLATILIVDDEKHTRDGLRMSLEDDFDVYVAADKVEAMEVLANDAVDVMVTDLRLGGDDGMELIDEALRMSRPPICFMMTAYGSESVAVEAMKRGAHEYVTKPLNIDELEILIKRALKTKTIEKENRVLKQQVERTTSVSNIIGKSEAMKPVLEVIEQVAPTRATVLIEGESGTGKELVARAIHNLSGRPKAKLVVVHCAALSPQLLESELFGHEKGAFTGASEKRVGRFELADGGTLVLDEIGEIDAATQVKLLRALGEQTIERVGGGKPIQVDVRVVAATNKNLAEMVKKGEFREDLYFRLNVVRIEMPPLRVRKEDIVLLTGHFLKVLAEENNKPYRELSSDAMDRFLAYDWPGNVRELRTAVEHGVVMNNGSKITSRHLPAFLRGGPPSPVMQGQGGGNAGRVVKTAADVVEELGTLRIDEMERFMILKALERTDENRTEAAQLLGISRRTLQRKLKEMQEEF